MLLREILTHPQLCARENQFALWKDEIIDQSAKALLRIVWPVSPPVPFMNVCKCLTHSGWTVCVTAFLEKSRGKYGCFTMMFFFSSIDLKV